VESFDWDVHNEGHVWKHDIAPAEAEDAMRDPDRLPVGAYNREGEKRWAILGATEHGRRLFVVFTTRRDSIRVVMARPANSAEARRYRRGR
jgi:uncharacterized protein